MSGVDRVIRVQFVDFIDFFARQLEFEVVLTTGFSVDITEEYDTIATSTPRLIRILWDTSGEREDFLYVNEEGVLTNVQQAAVAFDGYLPTNALVDMGVATSQSNQWDDFQSMARPAVRESGKIFILERKL